MIADTIAHDRKSAGIIEWFAPRRNTAHAAAFLDRDGVINEHIAGGYVLGERDFRWLPGALATLRRLGSGGMPLFVVTNQSCVNKGLLDVSLLRSMMTGMADRLNASGVACDGWLCCPHRSDECCACRKPGSAMLERAASVTGVHLAESVLIGDSSSDIEAARRVGMRGFLVERNEPGSLAAVVDQIVGETE